MQAAQRNKPGKSQTYKDIQLPTSARLHCRHADWSGCWSDFNWSSCSHGDNSCEQKEQPHHSSPPKGWINQWCVGAPDYGNRCFPDKGSTRGRGRKRLADVITKLLRGVIAGFSCRVGEQKRQAGVSGSTTEPRFCSTPEILLNWVRKGLIGSQQEPPCLKRRWLCMAVTSICLAPDFKNERGSLQLPPSSCFSSLFRWCCLFTQHRTQLSRQR